MDKGRGIDGEMGRARWDCGSSSSHHSGARLHTSARLTVPRLRPDATASCMSARVSDHAETYRRTWCRSRSGSGRWLRLTPAWTSQLVFGWVIVRDAVAAVGRPVVSRDAWCA
jgi:hypothetical protein